jgi:hypothetical protein
MKLLTKALHSNISSSQNGFLDAFAVLIFLLLTSSCKKSESEVMLDKNLLRSAAKYNQIFNNRSDGEGSFTIEDVKREENVMTIHVKGGCSTDDFQVIWDGVILESYPGQVRLILHNTTQNNCGKEKKLNIRIDLSKIIGNQDPKHLVFHVANGSVKQLKSLNPNGSVSSE